MSAEIVAASSEDVTCSNLERKLNELFGRGEWDIKIHFNRKQDLSTPDGAVVTCWDVVVEAEIFSVIQTEVYYGNDKDNLKMEVELIDYHYCDYYGNSALPAVKITDLVPQTVETADSNTSNHKCYEKIGVSIPRPAAPRPGYNSQDDWNISVSILGADFISVADLLPPFSDTGRQIFTEKRFCDFEIISEDGTSTPCHKIFLCAGSPVLATMLEGDLKEAKENKMAMREMSTRGVTAFLKFLYSHNVVDALKCSHVAMELLKAADVYDIPLLWKILIEVLGKRSPAWIDVDVALVLYQFFAVCKRENNSSLKTKMLGVLALKSEELSKSSLYNQLFPSSVAKEMFADSLKLIDPGFKL